MKVEGRFSRNVVDWWIKWSRIHRKSLVTPAEAESELDTLKDLVTALKGYHSK